MKNIITFAHFVIFIKCLILLCRRQVVGLFLLSLYYHSASELKCIHKYLLFIYIPKFFYNKLNFKFILPTYNMVL